MMPHVSGLGALDIYHLFLRIVKTILTLYV